METQNNELNQLPNIGTVLAQKLQRAGIENAQALKHIGAENAFIRLHTIDNDACINMLYAIEGAIQGIRWHNLDKWRKDELKAFYNITNK